MRWLVLGTACVALAGCSQRVDRDGGGSASDSAGPNVNVTAAPGVAFDYRYAFRLPAERIASAQEAHAQACERLGVARCRITGLRYTLNGENDITASLQFKLDPAIARGFGKQGIDLVKAAEGTLVDAEITGADAGAAATQARSDQARAGGEVARLDEAIRRAHGDAERSQLQAQRAEAAGRVAAAADTASAAQASLATTPMRFDYGSGPAVSGFDPSAPLSSAWTTALGSARLTLAAALGALALFGPPALLALLVWFAWRRLRPRWRRFSTDLVQA